MKIGKRLQRPFRQSLVFRESLDTAFPAGVSPSVGLDKLHINIPVGITCIALCVPTYPPYPMAASLSVSLSVCPEPTGAVLYTEVEIPAGPGNVLLLNRPEELGFPHWKKDPFSLPSALVCKARLIPCCLSSLLILFPFCTLQTPA